MYFVGDFNFPDIDWLSLPGACYLSNYFCECIFDCNLSQHAMESTHTKGNILDLVLTSPNVSIRELAIHSSFSAVTDSEKASLFNKYFYSVFTKNSFQLPPVSELKRPQTYMGEVTITEVDVFQALKALDVSKAMGCDNISPRHLPYINLFTIFFH